MCPVLESVLGVIVVRTRSGLREQVRDVVRPYRAPITDASAPLSGGVRLATRRSPPSAGASCRYGGFRTSTARRGPKPAWNRRYPQGYATHRVTSDPPICRDFRRRPRLAGVPENRGVPSSSLDLAMSEEPP
jgi:hypothetical protein